MLISQEASVIVACLGLIFYTVPPRQIAKTNVNAHEKRLLSSRGEPKLFIPAVLTALVMTNPLSKDIICHSQAISATITQSSTMCSP